MNNMELTWKSFLSHDEKNRILFNRQKALLDLFLSNGAITKREYDTLTTDLSEKMGMLSAWIDAVRKNSLLSQAGCFYFLWKIELYGEKRNFIIDFMIGFC